MSGSESSLHLGIDASGAKQGAAAFTQALGNIEKAVSRLDKASDIVFEKLRTKLSGMDFSKLAKDMGSMSGVKFDPAMPGHVRSLGAALAGFRAPSHATSNDLSAFAKAMGQLRNPSAHAGNLAAIKAAISGFRSPTPQQVTNLESFIHALNNIKITANVPELVAHLNAITTAARAASSALAGVRGTNLPRIPRSYGGGGGGGGGGGPYGPRGPYGGVFSGTQRATGELRGFENVANPSFQTASIIRTMLPALTSGELLSSLYKEGAALVTFQHVLEIATTVPGDAIQSQHNLADAMQFVTDTAQKYGISLETARSGFARFAAAGKLSGYTMQELQRTYTATASSIRAMNLDDERASIVMRALDTTMAQDYVSLIQLHRQLDVAMPGIQNMVAQVVFNAQRKMAPETALSSQELEKAQLLLNKMASHKEIGPTALFEAMVLFEQKTAPALPRALNSPMAALERFRNQWILTRDTMNANGLFDEMGKQLNRLTDTLNRPDVQTMFTRLALGIADAVKIMGNAVVWAADHMDLLITALKVFVFIGAAESAMRLAAGFRSLFGFVRELVSPLTSTVGQLSRIVGLGVAATLEGITGQASAGATAFRALGAAGSAALGLISLGAVGALAVLVENRNEISHMDDSGATFGDHMKAVFDITTGAAGTLFDKLTGITGLLSSGGNTTWADRVETVFLSIAAVVSWLIERVEHLKNIGVSYAQSYDNVIGQGVFGLPGGAPATPSPEAPMHDLAFWLEANRRTVEGQTLKDRIATNSPGNTSLGAAGAFGGEGGNTAATAENAQAYTAQWSHGYLNPQQPKGGASPSDRMQNQLDSTLKSLTPDLSMIEKYEEEIANIQKAQQMGVHSKGAEMVAAGMGGQAGKDYLSGEYTRAIQAAKDKMMEAVGATSAYDKEVRSLAIEEQRLNALVVTGNMTRDRANQLMAQAREHAEKILNPYAAYTKQLSEENRLLLMGNKERQVETELDAMVKKAKDNEHALTTEQTDALREQLKIHQQLQEYQANQNVGLQAWENSFKDLYTELGKVEEKIAGSLTDALSKFIESPKEFAKGGGWSAMFKSIDADFIHMGVQSGLGMLTDALGLTKGTGADAHGSSILGPLAQGFMGLLGINIPGSKPPGKLDANGKPTDPIAVAMAAHGGAMPVVMLNKDASAMPGTSLGNTGPQGQTVDQVMQRLRSAAAAANGGGGGGISGGGGGTGGGGGYINDSGDYVDNGTWDNGTPSDIGTSASVSGGGSNGMSAAGAGGAATSNMMGYLNQTNSGGGGGTGGGGGNSFGSMANVVAAAGARQGGAAGGLTSMVPSLLNMFSSKGLLGSDGMLFGKTGLLGSSGPFSAGGLFGSQGPMFGNMPWTGQGGWLSNTFGANSLAGSNGWFAQRFGDNGGGLFNPIDQSAAGSSGGLFSSTAASAGNATMDAGMIASGAADDAIMNASSAFGSAASSFATGGAMGLSNLLGTGAADFSPLMNAFADPMGGILGAFAEGGYSTHPVGVAEMPHHKWANRSIPSYYEGIQNTSGGIPAMLHPGEAVIPLSRGRKIPVDMGNRGGQMGGGGDTHIHFNVTTPNADSFRASQTQINTSLANAVARAQGRTG